MVGLSCICLVLSIEISKTIDRFASIFTAECVVLVEAMNIVNEHSDTNFTIFMDSLSVLESLQNVKINVKTNAYILKITETYNKISFRETNFVNFVYVPAHIDIEGNERTDVLAKNATISENIQDTIIPFTYLFDLHLWKRNP